MTVKTYDRAYMLMQRGVAGGDSPTTCTEQWSFSHWWGPVDGSANPPVDVGQDVCDAAWGALADFLDDTTMLWNDNVFATEVRMYEYSSYLKAIPGTTRFRLSDATRIWYHVGAGTHGGSSATRLPLQCSLAVTLQDGKETRPFRHGRFYLPTQGIVTGQDGLIANTKAGEILSSTHDYLNAVNEAWGLDTSQDYELMVAARTAAGALNSVYGSPVRELRVGRVIDTQRKRRNALDETYVSTTYGV
jgi:hypothetical protein